MSKQLLDYFYDTTAMLVSQGVFNLEVFHDDARFSLSIADENEFLFSPISNEKSFAKVQSFEEDYQSDSPNPVSLKERFKYIFNSLSFDSVYLPAKNVESLIVKHSIAFFHQDENFIKKLSKIDINKMEFILKNLTSLRKHPILEPFLENFLANKNIKKILINNSPSYHDNSQYFLKYINKLQPKFIDQFYENLSLNSNDKELLIISHILETNESTDHSYLNNIQARKLAILNGFQNLPSDLINEHFSNNESTAKYYNINLKTLSNFYEGFGVNTFKTLFNNDLLTNFPPADISFNLDNSLIHFKFHLYPEKISLYCSFEKEPSHIYEHHLVDVINKYISKYIYKNLALAAHHTLKQINYIVVHKDSLYNMMNESFQETRSQNLYEKLSDNVDEKNSINKKQKI